MTTARPLALSPQHAPSETLNRREETRSRGPSRNADESSSPMHAHKEEST
jgi:hypothetical protein